jgi:Protein of unknown function (DUF3179)
MTIIAALLLVALSAVACLTQSMPTLKLKPPPNVLSYVTFRYRPAFAAVCFALGVWIAWRWAAGGSPGWLAPSTILLSAAIWVSLVITPAILFAPFRGPGQLIGAAEAAMVSDDATVIGVVVDGKARAYPEPMMMPQHVITDELAGQRIMVSWCPLCHSGMVFDGNLRGQPVEPRVVGGGNNNVLIYDTNSKNMYQQITGEILEGPDKGKALDVVPSMISTWREWRAEHPDTTVWVRNPGSLFECVSRTLTLWAPTTILDKQKPFYRMDRPADPRLGYTMIVSGVDVEGRRKAFPHEAIVRQPIVNDLFSGVPLAVFSTRAGTIVRFFDRRVGESTLRFRAASAHDVERGIVARDLESGTGWTIDGVAADGKLAETRLAPVRGITRCFWFAFAHFYPGSEIWDGEAGLDSASAARASG